MSEIAKRYLQEVGAPATVQRIVDVVVDGACEDKIVAKRRNQLLTVLNDILGYENIEGILVEVISTALTEEDMLEIISLRQKHPVLVKAMGTEYQKTMEDMYKKRLGERFQEKKQELDAVIEAAYEEHYASKKSVEGRDGSS